MSQQNKEKDLKFQTFLTKFGSYSKTDWQNMHILLQKSSLWLALHPC